MFAYIQTWPVSKPQIAVQGMAKQGLVKDGPLRAHLHGRAGHWIAQGRRGARLPAAAQRRDPFPQQLDHYATLQVPRGASQQQIKDAYRRLQKRFHPDRSVSGEGDAVRSATINAAFVTLTDGAARKQHDAALRSSGAPAATIIDQEGLVGPVVSSGILIAETLPDCSAEACDIDSQEEMIHFVRQWGGTLAWNAELPLPLPLQFDETTGGCRLGFVRVNDGAVQLVGELRFSVLPAEAVQSSGVVPDPKGAPFLVTVCRQGSSKPLPGEDRILQSFRSVCRARRSPSDSAQRGFQLSGFLATILAGAVGGLPFMGSENKRTYERYHLKRNMTIKSD